jgi:flagellar biosynthesis component FlhA
MSKNIKVKHSGKVKVKHSGYIAKHSKWYYIGMVCLVFVILAIGVYAIIFAAIAYTIYYIINRKNGNEVTHSDTLNSIKENSESNNSDYEFTQDEESEPIEEQAPINNPIDNNTFKYNDPYEELKKLKDLLDLGIITQDEFDIKKKELLGL